jgi:hypothetical protein
VWLPGQNQCKPYFGFLKMALKIRINAIPPMHMTRRTSGVIWSIACIFFGFRNESGLVI